MSRYVKNEGAENTRSYLDSDRPPPRLGQVSTLLPLDARRALVVASQTTGELERAKAVQKAIDFTQLRYPQFFNKE